MRFSSSFIVFVAAATQLGVTCDGGITRDPGFDLWCGDTLCTWKLERGFVSQAPTWHGADYGVELVDPDTAIEQFTPIDYRDGTCVTFELVADVAGDAQVELVIDIYGDGSIERSFAIPTAHWEPLTYTVSVTRLFTGIRFEISKRGRGHAAVARMSAVAHVGYNCASPISGGPAPLGALCFTASDCASGMCGPAEVLTRRCVGCDPATPACGGGQVCGLTDPSRPERTVPIACVAPGVRVLGEQCLGNAECTTGTCAGGVCSTCRPGAECGIAACTRAYDEGPFLCAAGGHLAPHGAPCATNNDCASRACSGPVRRQCLDGRACATDDDCPVDDKLVPGPCLAVGVQGGSCD